MTPNTTWREALASAERPLVGMWVCSGSPLVAEICAGSGLDWLLIDAEHSPNDLASILAQLQAVAAYPVTPLVRPPSDDQVTIKQYLDLGAQNLLIPMIDSADQARAAVRSTRYPPAGVRGVGSALARASRWNRTPDYLDHAEGHVSLVVQIESTEAVGNCRDIADVDGVDAVFVGPSDLAASMGKLGRQDHPAVQDVVRSVIEDVRRAGKPVGVNAFKPETAHLYLDAGADFVLVGADVALLARGSESLASMYIHSAGDGPSSSY
ncbi:HpcH/HpaI aldolase/citrate lyase family protein [Streptomyces sp. NPDC057474]|uniref:HpcH/HpaI aldolase family protein n=1 Tax=Streptomyces sp. NPDC057474 TaxID=3346144 RepID=UPI0036BD0770